MPLLKQRECAKCGTRFELYEARGKTTVFDRDDDQMICPVDGCGEPVETARAIVSAPLVVGVAGYPRFNAGLGMVVDSRSHEKRIEQERGLIPLEGAAGSMHAEWKRHQEAAEAHHAAVRRGQAEAIEACPETRRALDIMAKEAKESGQELVR